MHVCTRIHDQECLEQHCSQRPKLEKKSPSTGEWINKLWCIHKREFNSDENGLELYARAWMNLTNILL